jgi:hypothetical protein
LQIRGTTKVLYEPKTNYKIDRIEVMVDKSNPFISETIDGELGFAGSIT